MTSEFYNYKYAQTEELKPRPEPNFTRLIEKAFEDIFGGVDV